MPDLYYWQGTWSEEQPKVVGPADVGFWSSTSVFDGARAVQGCAPDLDKHCARLIRSAISMLLTPTMTAEEVQDLCVEGIRRLPTDRDYYVRPMMFAEESLLLPEPDKTRFTLAIIDLPLPDPVLGGACLSPYRRNAPNQAPTDAKAGALYPNSQRAMKDAVERGYQAAVVLDPDGNVAEFAHANLWLAKDGVAISPKPNGTFLDGITKARVIDLMGKAGIEVRQETVTVEDLQNADEIFVTGNYGKVQALNRFEDRDMQPGPVFQAARDAYMDWMATTKIV